MKSEKPNSLLRDVGLWALISTLGFVALGGVMLALSPDSEEPLSPDARSPVEFMILQVPVGLTMGVLIGFLAHFGKKLPARKPKGTLRRRMVTAGILWGALAAGFASLAGARLLISLLVGVIIGAVFSALSGIGYKRQEREWSRPMDPKPD